MPYGIKYKIGQLLNICNALDPMAKSIKVTMSTDDETLTLKVSARVVAISCARLLSTSEIARRYGQSARWLNTFLAANNVQQLVNGKWNLKPIYQEKGYTATENGRKGWTQKGKRLIENLLENNGYFPKV